MFKPAEWHQTYSPVKHHCECLVKLKCIFKECYGGVDVTLNSLM